MRRRNESCALNLVLKLPLGNKGLQSKDIQRFKSYTAKQLLQYFIDHNIKTLIDQFAFYKKAHKIETQYQFWQEGTHPELIQNNEMMYQKIIYIHGTQ